MARPPPPPLLDIAEHSQTIQHRLVVLSGELGVLVGHRAEVVAGLALPRTSGVRADPCGLEHLEWDPALETLGQRQSKAVQEQRRHVDELQGGGGDARPDLRPGGDEDPFRAVGAGHGRPGRHGRRDVPYRDEAVVGQLEDEIGSCRAGLAGKGLFPRPDAPHDGLAGQRACHGQQLICQLPADRLVPLGGYPRFARTAGRPDEDAVAARRPRVCRGRLPVHRREVAVLPARPALLAGFVQVPGVCPGQVAVLVQPDVDAEDLPRRPEPVVRGVEDPRVGARHPGDLFQVAVEPAEVLDAELPYPALPGRQHGGG